MVWLILDGKLSSIRNPRETKSIPKISSLTYKERERERSGEERDDLESWKVL